MKLLNLRKKHPELSVKLFYDQMIKDEEFLPSEISYSTLYRFFNKHDLVKNCFQNKSSPQLLNKAFFRWLEKDYHRKKHTSLDDTTLKSYMDQIDNKLGFT